MPNDGLYDGKTSKWLAWITTPVQRVRHDVKRGDVDRPFTMILCSKGTRYFYDLCFIIRLWLRDSGGCDCYRRHRAGVQH